MKSSVDEIRKRFDADVERFSSLETGQSATMDAPLVLELITSAAAAVTPGARRLLDVGCGAGNYSLKMLQKVGGLDVTLVDLSEPMLQAKERVSAAGAANVTTIRGDIREIELGDEAFDLILAGAVLHHLRTEEQWSAVFGKFFGAWLWGDRFGLPDLVEHSLPGGAGGDDAAVRGVSGDVEG